MAEEIIIDESNYTNFLRVSGKAYGLTPRDYSKNPAGVYASSVDDWDTEIPVFDRSELPDRIRQKEKDKSRLSDIRNRGDRGRRIQSLDQNGQGFCWAYGPTAMVTLLRAAANLPHVRLSAHSVACKIFNFKDRGAWGALALDFIARNGVCSVNDWPEKSMSRSNDNERAWQNAKANRVDEGWMDMQVNAYDRKLSIDQIFACLLSNLPVGLDFNWWGHHVCGCDVVDVKPQLPATDLNRYGIRIWNSWTDNWSDNGMGVISGEKLMPMGACCARTVVAG